MVDVTVSVVVARVAEQAELASVAASVESPVATAAAAVERCIVMVWVSVVAIVVVL